MVHVQGTSPGGRPTGRQFTRRQVLQYGGGLASLVALGIVPIEALAQGTSGPAQLFNPSETPPTAVSLAVTTATPAMPPKMVSTRVNERSSVGVLTVSMTVSINSFIRYSTTAEGAPEPRAPRYWQQLDLDYSPTRARAPGGPF